MIVLVSVLFWGGSDSGVSIGPHPLHHPFRHPQHQCCIRDSSYHSCKVLNSQSQLHVNVNGHHENDDNNHTMVGNGAVQDLGALGQNNINGIINNHHKMMILLYRNQASSRNYSRSFAE
ncbi:unnamed protein product [Rhizophagus irregularis]|nr:unnamed protein product [Rhizophagus irregularis]CAB5370447.1 unnamed protein product [Rhizophagus irregularis]